MLILIVKLKQKATEIHTSPTYHGLSFSSKEYERVVFSFQKIVG